MRTLLALARLAARRAFPWLLAAGPLAGCGVADAPASIARQPILDGTEDSGDPAVVMIDVLLPTGEELCTGYLITADLVLTARHCVAPVVNPSGGCTSTGAAPFSSGGEPLDPSKLTVMTDATYTTESKFLPVAEVTVLPDSVGQTMCGNDIALLRLTAPLDAIPPIALQVATAPAVGDGFTAIGYGVSTPSNLDSSGIRRSRTGLAVTDVGETDRTTDGEWIADTGPCGGDSGSPALDANGASFGVMTRGKKSTCTSMVYERIDVHADFLVEQARASAARLGVAAPDWAGGAGGAGGAGSGVTTGTGGAKDADAPEDGSSGCSVGSGQGAPGSFGVLAVAIAWLGARRRAR